MKILILRLLIGFIFTFSTYPLLAQGPVNALKLDGQEGYVLSSTSNRGIGNQITVSAWVHTTSSKYMWVVGKYDRYGAERGFHLIIKEGKAAFAGRDGSGAYRNSGYSSAYVNDGKWHHITGICDGNTWLIYVDGILQNQTSSYYAFTNLTNNAPLVIGKDYLVDNEYFTGEIDEIRIWNKALDLNEIRDQMCTKFNRLPENLIAYFTFDNLNSSLVDDLSPLNLDGQLQNASPSTTWVTSGAPIGDESLYVYPWNWTDQYVNPLQVEDSKGRLFIDGWEGESPQGLQMYFVRKDGRESDGHAVTELVDYYGFFTPLAPAAKAKLRYFPFNACSVDIQEREQNSSIGWQTLSVSEQNSQFTTVSSSYRGEYKISDGTGTLMITGTPSMCAGTSTELTANTTSPVVWSTGETTRSIKVSRGGSYQVTATLNGCMLTGTITVEEVPLPAVNLGADKMLCIGQTTVLTAPAGYIYRWSNGKTTPTIEVGTAGTYWVEVTNSNGCTVRDEVNLSVKPQPVIPLPREVRSCSIGQVFLNATTPGATYLWSNGQTTPTIEVTAPADLSVAVTVNGCIYYRQVSVIVDNSKVVSIQSTGDFCTGSSSTLSISTSGSVLWSTGETSKSIIVSKAGEYNVTVTEGNCTYADKIIVVEATLPEVNLGEDMKLCSGEVYKLQAPTGAYTYKWNTGESTAAIEARATGTYWVEVTNSNGCTVRDEVSITSKPQPDIPLQQEVISCYGERVTLNANTPGATYLWSNGQTTPGIHVTAPASLSVAVTVDGCTYTKQVTVASDECPVIPNIITPNGDGKNDSFVLKGINIDAVSIEIFNRWGNSVFKRESYDNSWAGAGSGMYYYHIKSRQTQKEYKGWFEVVK